MNSPNEDDFIEKRHSNKQIGVCKDGLVIKQAQSNEYISSTCDSKCEDCELNKFVIKESSYCNANDQNCEISGDKGNDTVNRNKDGPYTAFTKKSVPVLEKHIHANKEINKEQKAKKEHWDNKHKKGNFIGSDALANQKKTNETIGFIKDENLDDNKDLMREKNKDKSTKHKKKVESIKKLCAENDGIVNDAMQTESLLCDKSMSIYAKSNGKEHDRKNINKDINSLTNKEHCGNVDPSIFGKKLVSDTADTNIDITNTSHIVHVNGNETKSITEKPVIGESDTFIVETSINNSKNINDCDKNNIMAIIEKVTESSNTSEIINSSTVDANIENKSYSCADNSNNIGSDSNIQDKNYHPVVFEDFTPDKRYSRLPIVLGHGSQKIVYKAIDSYDAHEVAWNVISLSQCPAHFLDEITLLKSINHPNIIKLKDYYLYDNNLVFITELMTSGTLREYLKTVKPSLRIIRSWSLQILAALSHLHSKSMIHRDIKCENIFINGSNGQVKIGDLGIAKRCAQRRYTIVGTPEFMAREVFEGDGYGEGVDVYAFGMALLEMSTGEYPYSECNNTREVFRRIMVGIPPEALYKVNNACLRRLIIGCLSGESERITLKECIEHHFFVNQEEEKGSNNSIHEIKMKDSDINTTSKNNDNKELSTASKCNIKEKDSGFTGGCVVCLDFFKTFTFPNTYPPDITSLSLLSFKDTILNLQLFYKEKDRFIKFDYDITKDSVVSVVHEMIQEKVFKKEKESWVNDVMQRGMEEIKGKLRGEIIENEALREWVFDRLKQENYQDTILCGELGPTKKDYKKEVDGNVLVDKVDISKEFIDSEIINTKDTVPVDNNCTEDNKEELNIKNEKVDLDSVCKCIDGETIVADEPLSSIATEKEELSVTKEGDEKIHNSSEKLTIIDDCVLEDNFKKEHGLHDMKEEEKIIANKSTGNVTSNNNKDEDITTISDLNNISSKCISTGSSHNNAQNNGVITKATETNINASNINSDPIKYKDDDDLDKTNTNSIGMAQAISNNSTGSIDKNNILHTNHPTLTLNTKFPPNILINNNVQENLSPTLSSNTSKKNEILTPTFNEFDFTHTPFLDTASISDFVQKTAVVTKRDADTCLSWIKTLLSQEIETIGELRIMTEEDWDDLGLTVFSSRAMKNMLYGKDKHPLKEKELTANKFTVANDEMDIKQFVSYIIRFIGRCDCGKKENGVVHICSTLGNINRCNIETHKNDIIKKEHACSKDNIVCENIERLNNECNGNCVGNGYDKHVCEVTNNKIENITVIDKDEKLCIDNTGLTCQHGCSIKENLESKKKNNTICDSNSCYDNTLLINQCDKCSNNDWITKLLMQDVRSVGELKSLTESDWERLELSVFARRIIKNAVMRKGKMVRNGKVI